MNTPFYFINYDIKVHFFVKKQFLLDLFLVLNPILSIKGQ